MVRLTRRGKIVAAVIYFGVIFAISAQLPSETELMNLCNDC